ncbi:hypothetical protein XENORESO_002573 [Xenotaenia resolanae]|uniref:Uncharacterized protein n=1 Tax=Xenotaenia resolanae TaxID=208358 RepID=A0ABV0WI57_9TELE
MKRILHLWTSSRWRRGGRSLLLEESLSLIVFKTSTDFATLNVDVLFKLFLFSTLFLFYFERKNKLEKLNYTHSKNAAFQHHCTHHCPPSCLQLSTEDCSPGSRTVWHPGSITACSAFR